MFPFTRESAPFPGQNSIWHPTESWLCVSLGDCLPLQEERTFFVARAPWFALSWGAGTQKADFCQVLSAFCKVLSALLSFAAKKELIALGISQIWTQKTTGSISQLFMCFCMPELVWIDFPCIREIWGINDTCLPLKTLFKNNNNTIISMTFIALPWGN